MRLSPSRLVILAAIAVVTLVPPGASVAETHDVSSPAPGVPVRADAATRPGPPQQDGRSAPRRLHVLGDDMVFRRGRSADLPMAKPRSPARIKLLAARVYVGSVPQKAMSTKETKSLLQDTAKWFHATSRGRQSMHSRVTRWIRLPLTRSSMCGGEFAMAPTVARAVRAAGYGLGGTNRLMMLMPQCGGTSSGEVDGPLTWIREARPNLPILAHELGHNLGLTHANSAICRVGDLRVTLSKKCASQEYGDLWDAMGISERPYSVAVLARLGWAGKILTPAGSGTFTLADAEHSGHAVQGMRVAANARRSYWLEFHPQTVSFGSSPTIVGAAGVQIRLDTGARSLRILDALPGTAHPYLSFPDPDFVDVTLPVGSSFTTPENIRITVTAQDGSSAQVQISRGQKASAPDTPVLRAAISQYGGGHDLYLDPPASDHGQVVLGYRVTSLPSGTVSFVHDPAGLQRVLTLQDHLGSAYAVSAVNQAGSSSPTASLAARAAAPVASISSPVAGASIDGHTVQVAVAASPDVVTGSPVSSVTACLFHGDGNCYVNARVEDQTAPYAMTLQQPSAGLQTLEVVVTDVEGNSVRLTQPVTVLGMPPSLTVTSPANGETTGTDVHVVGTATPNASTGSPLAFVNVDLWAADGHQAANGYAEGGGAFDVLLTGVPAGSYTLVVRAYDAADEWAEVTRAVTVAP